MWVFFISEAVFKFQWSYWLNVAQRHIVDMAML
jgi:hypothetical protein